MPILFLSSWKWTEGAKKKRWALLRIVMVSGCELKPWKYRQHEEEGRMEGLVGDHRALLTNLFHPRLPCPCRSSLLLFVLVLSRPNSFLSLSLAEETPLFFIPFSLPSDLLRCVHLTSPNLSSIRFLLALLKWQWKTWNVEHSKTATDCCPQLTLCTCSKCFGCRKNHSFLK